MMATENVPLSSTDERVRRFMACVGMGTGGCEGELQAVGSTVVVTSRIVITCKKCGAVKRTSEL